MLHFPPLRASSDALLTCGAHSDPVGVQVPIINPLLAIDIDYTAPKFHPVLDVFDAPVIGSNVVFELPNAPSVLCDSVQPHVPPLRASFEALHDYGAHLDPAEARLPVITVSHFNPVFDAFDAMDQILAPLCFQVAIDFTTILVPVPSFKAPIAVHVHSFDAPTVCAPIAQSECRHTFHRVFHSFASD